MFHVERPNIKRLTGERRGYSEETMNLSNTCGTCRFFGILRDAEDPDSLRSVPDTYALCGRIKHDERYSGLPGERALLVDGSGYWAALCVMSDFGCNLWEQKP